MRFAHILVVASVAVLSVCLSSEAPGSSPEPYSVPSPSNSLFFETFQNDWRSRWVVTEDEDFDGEWTVAKGALHGIPEVKGLIVNSAAKKHAVSSAFSEAVTMDNEDLVVQYEIRFHKKLECGGAYLKLVRNTEDLFVPEEFNSNTDYVVMFGPDKCGSTNKIHFIFKHRNPITELYEEKHLKNPPSFTVDTETHLYTLVIKRDNSFEIFVDQKSVKKGSLLNDFDPPVNPPELIDDPTDLKPVDWVDEAKIPDPEATKPEDWDESAPRQIRDPDAKKPTGWLDEAPLQIPDPAAVKPEDWDDELDGEYEAPLISNPACEQVGCGVWEPPMINNPEYKGKWSPPLIDNPVYKGVWKAKQIPNPHFFVDEHPHNLSPIAGVGFELWTMQDGIQFDNIFVGRDAKSAHAWAQQTFVVKSNAENEAKKSEEKLKKKEKIESQLQNGFMGKLEAYSEIAGDFISEHPIPVFCTIVALLVGMVVFFEYRRPKTDDSEEEVSLEPEQAQELLKKLTEKLEKEGKLSPVSEAEATVDEGVKEKSE